MRLLSIIQCTGGFYGSTDPAGELLQKKRAMLLAEGVSFDDAAAKKSKSAAGRKRKAVDSAGVNASDETTTTKKKMMSAAVDASKDTSLVTVSESSVFTFKSKA